MWTFSDGLDNAQSRSSKAQLMEYTIKEAKLEQYPHLDPSHNGAPIPCGVDTYINAGVCVACLCIFPNGITF